MSSPSILNGAYDLHLHVSPDVIPRYWDLAQLAAAVRRAGMAGVLLKDHCTITAGRAAALNSLTDGSCRFFSALALNPPVGDLNPVAVEAALREGADVIFFPTYGAANHIRLWGAGKPPTAFPLLDAETAGTSILIDGKSLAPEVAVILKLIADHDAVLGTGHISPEESLILLEKAGELGVKRMLVTHTSESVTPFSIAQQQAAVRMGAFIEHAFFAVTDSCPHPTTVEAICDHIRATGADRVILTSDLGQVANGDPLAGFARFLEQIMGGGFSEDAVRRMICRNPEKLIL